MEAIRRWIAALTRSPRRARTVSARKFEPVVVPFGDARPSYTPPPGRCDARKLQALLDNVYGGASPEAPATEPARRAEAG